MEKEFKVPIRIEKSNGDIPPQSELKDPDFSVDLKYDVKQNIKQ